MPATAQTVTRVAPLVLCRHSQRIVVANVTSLYRVAWGQTVEANMPV